MNQKKIENEILQEVSRSLPSFSYQKHARFFVRDFEYGQHAFHIGLIKQSNNQIKMAAKIKIYIDEVDELYMPFYPGFVPEDKWSYSTLGGNADGLIQNNWLIHGFDKNDTVIDRFTEEYIKAIKNDFLPWFERNSKIDRIYEILSNANHPDYVPGALHGELLVRLAILLYQRRWDEYDRVESKLHVFLNKRYGKQFVPKVVPVIEGLRSQVERNKVGGLEGFPQT